MEGDMEDYPVWVPKFCFTCGHEAPEDIENCENCGEYLAISWYKFNSLAMKYCIACGNKVQPDSVKCNKCGYNLKISNCEMHLSQAEALRQNDQKAESIAEAKKALPFAETPRDKFLACQFVASESSLLFQEKYGHLDDFTQKVLESEIYKDMLTYAKQAMEAFEACPSDFKKRAEGDPRSGVVGFRAIVEEFGKEIEKLQKQEGRNDITSNVSTKSAGGCFIATAVYDSAQAKEIEILRQYRDEVLWQTLVGKLFVNIYYRISPPFAFVISQSRMLKKLVRFYLLEPIIRILRKRQ